MGGAGMDIYEYRNNVTLLLSYMGYSIVTYIRFKQLSFEIINNVGINSRYYPKHYITLTGRMKKFLKVKQREIPRYCFFQLLLARFFLALGPVYVVITLATGFSDMVCSIIFMLHTCLALIFLVLGLIVLTLYKKSVTFRRKK